LEIGDKATLGVTNVEVELAARGDNLVEEENCFEFERDVTFLPPVLFLVLLLAVVILADPVFKLNLELSVLSSNDGVVKDDRVEEPLAERTEREMDRLSVSYSPMPGTTLRCPLFTPQKSVVRHLLFGRLSPTRTLVSNKTSLSTSVWKLSE